MGRFEARIDEGCVVWLSGELDLAVAAEFASVATSAMDGQRELVLDLSGLEFLDSAGIRAILETASSTDRGLVLRSPRNNVRKVLGITGIAGRDGIRVEPPEPSA